jgi:decaprenyl-phosphate phosphoribosyltransferase
MATTSDRQASGPPDADSSRPDQVEHREEDGTDNEHTGRRPSSEGGASLPMGLLKLARPRQWAKNLLVFAAPGAAGILNTRTPLTETVIAFVCFCLAAAGTYYINDAHDAEADRLHPKKRFRPVAAGVVPRGLAYSAGFGLLVAAVSLSFAVNLELAATVAAYVVLTTLYSNLLKNIPIFDLVAIAGGFVLRAVAGAAATDIPISNWFFIVTVFGSLFVVAGKRGAEAREMGEGAAEFRAVLATYSESYTAYLRSVTSTAMLIGYCVWAVEKAEAVGLSASEHPWYQLSILPFMMGVLRYALLLDQGRGSAPEDILVNDRMLQLIGLGWLVVFGIGVYTT